MYIIAETESRNIYKELPANKNETLSKIFIKSVSTIVRRKFHEFQQSGCNKTRSIELLSEYLQ